jgi:hypothetical protein
MGGHGHQVWIPFRPTQIKSAIGNSGAFDPENPDIRYAVEREINDNAAEALGRIHYRVQPVQFREIDAAATETVAEVLLHPQASENEVLAEKRKLKAQVVEGVRSGRFPAGGAVRFGTVDEIRAALVKGRLPVSREYGEIHATPIIDRDDDMFAAYGSYDRHNMAMFFPSDYVREKTDAHTKEVVIDENVPLDAIIFMIDGHDKAYTYAELKRELVRTARSPKFSARAEANPFARIDLETVRRHPRLKNAEVTQLENGAVAVRFAASDTGFTIEAMEDLEDGSAILHTRFGSFPAPARGQVAGAFLPEQRAILLRPRVAGAVTLDHEIEHFLEHSGLMQPGEIRTLNEALRRRGIRPSSEARAEFVARELARRERYAAGSAFGRLLQRVADSLAALAEIFGLRGARAVLRRIESGKTLGASSRSWGGTTPSRGGAGEDALYQAEERFAAQVDDALAGRMPPGEILTLGETPPVLQALGAEALPLVMDQQTLQKAVLPSGEGRGLHHLSADLIKQLPAQLSDPVMVFDSATQSNSLVVMTELEQGGKTVVAAVHLSKEKNRFIVNSVASVHQRRDDSDFARWEKEGLLRYRHNEKSRNWHVTRGLQLPKMRGANGGFDDNILTDDDLVKPSGGPGPIRYSAAAPRETMRRVIEAAQASEPGWDDGALISIPDARRRAGLSKAEFDAAVIALADEGKIFLHEHIHPYALPEAERTELVDLGPAELSLTDEAFYRSQGIENDRHEFAMGFAVRREAIGGGKILFRALEDAEREAAGAVNRWKESRPDTTTLERVFSTPLYHFSKVPALKGMFDAALKWMDDKHLVLRDLLYDGDGQAMNQGLEAFRRNRPAEAEAWNRYLVERDMEAIGHTVTRAEGEGENRPFILRAASDEGRPGAEMGRYGSEAEAWAAAVESEARGWLARPGASEQGAEAIRIFRRISHNIYDLIKQNVDAVIARFEESGRELPQVAVRDEAGGEIHVDLRTALLRMGDLRGHWFPRLRPPGRFVLRAVKEGANPIREHFDLGAHNPEGGRIKNLIRGRC